MSPFAWVCKRCKGPAIRGGAEFKPWVGPCPNCGGFYDADRIWQSDDAEDGEEAPGIPIKAGEVMSFNQVIAQRQADPAPRRIETGSPGFDWVLGGGIPLPIAILIASPPGGGKSTLLIEILRRLAEAGHKTLYCQSEESAQQLADRYGNRLGKFPDRFHVLEETDFEKLKESILRAHPAFAAIDSLNDLEGVTDSNDFTYSPNSTGSVTNAARQIKRLASDMGITIFTVAHVTKDGAIAGANTVQHQLDMTLYLNGQKRMVDDNYVIVGAERTLRCPGKNRFAPTHRVARFQMRDDGLHDLGPWLDQRPPWKVFAKPPNDEPEHSNVVPLRPSDR